MGTKSSSLWAPAPLDELDAFVQRHSKPDEPLLPSDSPSLELYISTHLLAPLLAHASLISRALVSLYIDDLHFLDHLDVLKAFWLGGDAGFTERVGAALFGKDQAGAGEALGLGRRARTRARLGLGAGGGEGELPQGEWGVGLGLGLSDRKKWPPGGAELAYALRTALLDDEIADLCHRGPVWESLEDRVSFAVRSLPEDDKDRRRARWLNPQAIEALDFLYLAYSPPEAIATLLPSSVMDKYQQVHNFLLRLSRIDAVLRLLYFTVLRPTQDGAPLKVGVDATYNKRPSRVGLPPRTQRGPFPSGSEAEKASLFLRYEMSWFVSSLSHYVLDTAIGHNWDVMRRRLDKLRRRGAVTGTDSRPMTPGAEYYDDYEDLDFELDEAGGDAESEGTAQLGSLSQLQSAHSLVLYHNIILNRILRACLLSDKPGHQVTFKILMALLALILDLAKTVTEVERGAVTVEEASAHVTTIRQDWSDKKAVFVSHFSLFLLECSPWSGLCCRGRGVGVDTCPNITVARVGTPCPAHEYDACP